MMASMDWIAGGGADGVVAWLLTYAVHSTILLGAAAVVTMRLVRADSWRETVWRAALVGALVTSALQSGLGMRPLAGEWRFSPVERGGAAPVELTGSPSDRARGEAGSGVVAQAPSSRSATDAPRPSRAQSEPVTPSRPAPAASPGTYPAASTLRWVLFASWAIVALLLLVRLAHRQWRLYRVLRDRRPVTDGDLLSVLAALRRNAGVWRPVELTASPACPSPLALGRSEICVPERLLWELDPEQQRSALAHELAHIARRDPGWHLLAGLVEAVFFFQPLNRVARLRLREAAEHLSDDWAVRQTGSALGLARCLAEVASWVGRGTGPVASGTMAMAEGGSPLLERVDRLLGARAGPVPQGRLRTVAATALVLAVLFAAPVVSAGDERSVASSGEHAASGGTVPPFAGRGGSESRAALQEQVIRHGAPDEPLDARWQWAVDEAGRRGDANYWVAYAFDRPLAAGDIPVEDSRGWSDSELDDVPLGTRIYGPSYRRPDEVRHAPAPQEETNPESLQPVLVLFRMVGSSAGTVHAARISVRGAAAGMPLDGAPLYWLGPASDAESFDWLRGRLDELHDVGLQATVVEAISMHDAADRVVPFLGEIIASARPNGVREDAVEGLVWQATDHSVELLRETALEDRSRSVREEATEALGDIGTPAAVAVLMELLSVARSDAVREQAVEALAKRREHELLETFTRVAMEDSDGGVREEALEAIAGFPSSSAVPALEQIVFTHRHRDMREEAVEALGDVDPTVALPRLARIVWSHPNRGIRREAVEALGRLPADIVLPELDDVVERHEDDRVVREAVEVIGRFPTDASTSRLTRIAQEHPSKRVRREARDQLADRPESP